MLEAQRAGRLPSVSAAVFRGEELAWSEAIGLADVEQGVEASPDTQYAVASITKTFTAASILQLRDEGKLDLEDPLSKHLPEAAHGTLTLRRMLAHASGLQREPPGEIWETLSFPDEEELLAGLEDAEQVLPPMAAWHYSNLAYALLGLVVARISGTPFREYVQVRLLGPVGLERTTWGPGDGRGAAVLRRALLRRRATRARARARRQGRRVGALQHGRRPRALGRVPLRPGRVGAGAPRRWRRCTT